MYPIHGCITDITNLIITKLKKCIYICLPFQESSGSPVPKRPRGRPKGSKNKGPSKKVSAQFIHFNVYMNTRSTLFHMFTLEG